ncbi:hypothetical protein [Pararhizobium sp. IMCC21322]|uniref:hypothetical protein n=1 Tax=Pararhizobium sp. IMCC21322 TaxID=3067903 RepID=UPI00274082DE|nr:hypothetical protein [Pararhizobium sp. IMCC21322]
MGQNTQDIENNIKRIQDRMSARVENISEDLNLSSLASRTLGAKGNSPGELLDAAFDTVKQHPIPAALIGAGLVGLLASQKSRTNVSGDVAPTTPHANGYQTPASFAATSSHPAERVASHVEDLKSEAQRLKATASEKLESAKAAVGDKVDHVADEAKRVYADAKNSVESGSSQLREQARHIGGSVSATGETFKRRAGDVPDQMRDTSSKAVEWAKENPVPLGLMALALGAAAATVLTAKKQTSSAQSEPLPQSDVTPHHIPAPDDFPKGSTSDLRTQADRTMPAYKPSSPVVSKPKAKTKSGQASNAATRKPANRKPSASSKTTQTGKTTPAGKTSESRKNAESKAPSTGADTMSRSGSISKS